MLDKPQITQTTAQTTAMIRLTIPRAEIRHVMEPGLGELMAAIAAQGITPTGPWLTHHLRMAPDIFDFEMQPACGSSRSMCVVRTRMNWPASWRLLEARRSTTTRLGVSVISGTQAGTWRGLPATGRPVRARKLIPQSAV